MSTPQRLYHPTSFFPPAQELKLADCGANQNQNQNLNLNTLISAQKKNIC